MPPPSLWSQLKGHGFRWDMCKSTCCRCTTSTSLRPGFWGTLWSLMHPSLTLANHSRLCLLPRRSSCLCAPSVGIVTSRVSLCSLWCIVRSSVRACRLLFVFLQQTDRRSTRLMSALSASILVQLLSAVAFGCYVRRALSRLYDFLR